MLSRVSAPCALWDTCEVLSPARRGLEDMPHTLLEKLAGEHLNRNACLQLFRSCRMLRDLILRQRVVALAFSLNMDAEQLASAVRSLDLVLRCHSPHSGRPVHLVFRGHQSIAEDSQDAARQVLSLVTSMRGRPLHEIQSVHLQDYPSMFSDVSWLFNALPSLTHLTVTLDPTRAPLLDEDIPHILQLKHLTLHITSAAYPQKHLHGLESQLRAIPALETLTLDNRSCFERCTPVLDCLSAVGTQLTQLNLITEPTLPTQLLLSFPQLHQLNVPCVDVGDEGMEVLLGLPQLRAIKCASFQDLKHSYINRVCPWNCVAVDVLDTESWSRLPLKGLRRVEFRSRVLVSANIADNIAVVTGLGHCEVLWADDQSLPVEVWGRCGDAVAECVEEICPLLTTCNASKVLLCVDRVTEPLLLVMKRHLGPALRNIGLSCGSFTEAAVTALLPALPWCVRTLFLIDGVADRAAGAITPEDTQLQHRNHHNHHNRQQRGITPEQLLVMCCQANRDIQVLVGKSPDPTKHLERVRDHLAQHQINQVTLISRRPSSVF